jgi:hypothetical protein
MRTRKVSSLTDAVRRAAAGGSGSLTDAVKEAARHGAGPGRYPPGPHSGSEPERVAPRFSAGTLDGHDGSQGGSHPWGPVPAADGSSARRPGFERRSSPQPEPEAAPFSPAGTQAQPARNARRRAHLLRSLAIARLRNLAFPVTRPALRVLASGARLTGIVLISFLSLVFTPSGLGPDHPVAAAAPQKRVALVIGNSDYRHARKLENPRNDAADVSAALKRAGFRVIEGFDLDKAGLDARIRAFTAALKGADVGLFFYAGHGLHVSGQSFLVPVDAELTEVTALDLELVRLDLIHRTMERETPTNLLFFDACRDNPLAGNLARAMGARSAEIGRGLSAAQSGAGTLISFSTQPGKLALDGKGRNSPYSSALVKQLTKSKEDLAGMLIAVRNEVMRETDRKQVPWEHSALTARFYFDPAGAKQAPAPLVQATAREAFEAWTAARETTSIGVLDAFIERYRDTFYAALARARIEELRRLEEAPLSSSVHRGAIAQ